MRDQIFLIFSGPIGVVKGGNVRRQLFPWPNLSRFASGDKTQPSNQKITFHIEAKKPCPSGRHGKIHHGCEKLGQLEFQVVSQGCSLNARITQIKQKTCVFEPPPAFSNREWFGAFHQQTIDSWIHTQIDRLGCESLTPKPRLRKHTKEFEKTN